MADFRSVVFLIVVAVADANVDTTLLLQVTPPQDTKQDSVESNLKMLEAKVGDVELVTAKAMEASKHMDDLWRAMDEMGEEGASANADRETTKAALSMRESVASMLTSEQQEELKLAEQTIEDEAEAAVVAEADQESTKLASKAEESHATDSAATVTTETVPKLPAISWGHAKNAAVPDVSVGQGTTTDDSQISASTLVATATKAMTLWDLSSDMTCADETKCSCDAEGVQPLVGIGLAACNTKCVESDSCTASFCDFGRDGKMGAARCSCHLYSSCPSTRVTHHAGVNYRKTVGAVPMAPVEVTKSEVIQVSAPSVPPAEFHVDGVAAEPKDVSSSSAAVAATPASTHRRAWARAKDQTETSVTTPAQEEPPQSVTTSTHRGAWARAQSAAALSGSVSVIAEAVADADSPKAVDGEEVVAPKRKRAWVAARDAVATKAT